MQEEKHRSISEQGGYALTRCFQEKVRREPTNDIIDKNGEDMQLHEEEVMKMMKVATKKEQLLRIALRFTTYIYTEVVYLFFEITGKF